MQAFDLDFTLFDILAAILDISKDVKNGHAKPLALWVKFSANDILKYFSYISMFFGKIRKVSPIFHQLNLPRE